MIEEDARDLRVSRSQAVTPTGASTREQLLGEQAQARDSRCESETFKGGRHPMSNSGLHTHVHIHRCVPCSRPCTLSAPSLILVNCHELSELNKNLALEAGLIPHSSDLSRFI